MARVATVRLVVFDLDGTLTLPHLIDFGLIKRRLGIAPEADILGEVAKLEGEGKERAMAVIHEEELRALGKDVFQPGLRELFDVLSKSSAKTAILTRNGAHAVEHFLEESGLRVDLAVDREFVPCKPSPLPLEHIMARLDVGPDCTVMIGACSSAGPFARSRSRAVPRRAPIQATQRTTLRVGRPPACVRC